MKRSKIFLGMAAVSFAAFGALAFTPKAFTTNAEYRRSSDNQCVPITVPQDCSPGGNTCKKPAAPDLNFQVHQLNSNCNSPLQLESGF
ncbi:DUF6520 family protein [Sphingobacterium siyangense]|uniref:DUF6520 family protein n=1 Tax=Sphingobacterium siyangense TaxID=459529 RepID=UPI0019657F30|nr:DUF6520 family protein [Sphingobacterium siyangense]QRY55563.1 hypothetical protein JVX97_16105 [Sphingobacterium siyangense]